MKRHLFRRQFLSFVMVMTMIFASTTVSYAAEPVCECEQESNEDNFPSIMPLAGVENWGKGTNVHVGTFDLVKHNLTPVKTITESGQLKVFGQARRPVGDGAFELHVEVREYPSGRVLCSSNSTWGCSCGALQNYSTPTINVSAGQRVQIDMVYNVAPKAAARVAINYTLR